MQEQLRTGRCPTFACFDTGTPATHCGLCAACFADLTPAKREDLIEAERAMHPPAEVVVQNVKAPDVHVTEVKAPDVHVHEVTNYVPHPRLRLVFAVAAFAGAVAGAAAFAALRWL